jgi:hypothetical protein
MVWGSEEYDCARSTGSMKFRERWWCWILMRREAVQAFYFFELEACLLWHCLALVAGWLVASLRCCLLAC